MKLSKIISCLIIGFVLILSVGYLISVICLTVFGCNNPELRKITDKKLSTRVLTKNFNMLSQDCLFVEVVENDLCVDSGLETDILENGDYIAHDDSTIKTYHQGDEFCLSIKNTNTVYSCSAEKSSYVLITPTMFNSNSRMNNRGITIYLGTTACLFIILTTVVFVIVALVPPSSRVPVQKIKFKEGETEKNSEKNSVNDDAVEIKISDYVKERTSEIVEEEPEEYKTEGGSEKSFKKESLEKDSLEK